MLLKNIYNTGIIHDDFHLRSSYFYSTGHWLGHAIDISKRSKLLKLISKEKFNLN
jgi:hypothetical protein